jgi:fumarylacetoacetase
VVSSWVSGVDGSGFPLQSLPYGIFSSGPGERRVGSAIGDSVVDLAALARAGLLEEAGADAAQIFAAPALNPFMAKGRPVWQAVRRRLTDLLTDERHRPQVEPALTDRSAVEMHLPFEVADYVDFYSSLHHAQNVGRMFRPDAEPLLPNWRHLPVAYHGRAGTIVVSGTPVRRPAGQRRRPDGEVVFGPSARLDIELEVGFVVGAPSALGTPVPAGAVADHIFGVVLVNDWSARDIQAWEYVPLGPFLGKSFATSVSAWVVPLEALEPYRVPGPHQEPTPLAYLQAPEPWALDLDLEVWIRPAGRSEARRISGTGFAQMYWSVGTHPGRAGQPSRDLLERHRSHRFRRRPDPDVPRGWRRGHLDGLCGHGRRPHRPGRGVRQDRAVGTGR